MGREKIRKKGEKKKGDESGVYAASIPGFHARIKERREKGGTLFILFMWRGKKGERKKKMFTERSTFG